MKKQEASLKLLASRTLRYGSGPGIRKLLAQLPLDTHVASDEMLDATVEMQKTPTFP